MAFDATNMRTGAQCIALSTSSSTLTLPTSGSSVIFGAAVKPVSGFSTADMWRFQEGSNAHVRISGDSSGHILIKVGTTTVATSTGTLTLNGYQFIEAKVVVADVGGSVTVKVGGTTFVTFSGDTRNGGTGIVDNITLTRLSSTMYMDDAYLLDTAGSAPYNDFLGDVVVRTLLPSGNGDSSDFTGSDGNSTDNYQLVDEANASSTDYVGASAASKTDLYAMGNIPATDEPLATQVTIYAGKSDTGAPPVLKPVTKGDGGTVLEESAVTLSTTYAFFNGAVRTTDPDGDALTAANVNAMQAGARTA